jgi:hypothetical protein
MVISPSIQLRVATVISEDHTFELDPKDVLSAYT